MSLLLFLLQGNISNNKSKIISNFDLLFQGNVFSYIPVLISQHVHMNNLRLFFRRTGRRPRKSHHGMEHDCKPSPPRDELQEWEPFNREGRLLLHLLQGVVHGQGCVLPLC